jgi:hypothetical protein
MVSWHLSNHIFRSPKCYKGFHWKPCTLELRVSQLDSTSIYRVSNSQIETRVSGHLRNRIFRPSKGWRVNQRKQDTLLPGLSWPLKNNIFKWTKCRQECRWVTQRKQDNLEPRLSWTFKYNIFKWPKCQLPWSGGFQNMHLTNQLRSDHTNKYLSFFKILKYQNFENWKTLWAPYFELLLRLRGPFWNNYVA